MKIIEKKIEEIKPFEKNAKIHDKKQITLLKENIKRFGFTTPLLISDDNEVIAGHGRLIAVKELDYKTVPCVLMSGLTKEEISALRLADNQINAMTGNDMNLVIEELKGLSDEMFDLTGFDRIIMEVEEDDFDAQKEYDQIVSPISKIGDKYEIGQHILVCGDSTQPEAYLGLMGQDKADLVFTDPPYNVDYKSQAGNGYSEGKYGNKDGKIFNDNKTDIQFQQFIQDMTKQCFDFSKENASLYMWYASRNQKFFKDGMIGGGWKWHQDVIWVKERFVFSMGCQYHRAYEPCMIGIKSGKYKKTKGSNNLSDIWEIKDKDLIGDMVDVWYLHRDKTNEYVHPTQKPIKLCERALRRNTEQKDIVMDVFGGSGSTLIACEQMNRKARLIELDLKYCDVIVNRFVKWTGNENIKLNGVDIIWSKTGNKQENE